MALGALIYIGQELHKWRVAKRTGSTYTFAGDGFTPRPPPPKATAPPAVMYIIVRRDSKAWAGPWHNNGTTFSTVPARWYRYKTAAEAQREVDTNDFLRHCTVEEDS